MFQNIIEKSCVKDLFRKLYNSPKYNEKYFEELYGNTYSLSDLISILFYDALYKYYLIIGDDKYLDDFVNGFSILIDKVNKIDDIRLGISNLIGKSYLKSNNINNDELEKNKESILNVIFNKYNCGLYLCGVNKKIYDKYKNNVDDDISVDVNNLKKLLKKYKYNLNDNYELHNNLDLAYNDSLYSPKYLYDILKLDNEDYNDNRKVFIGLNLFLDDLGVDNTDRDSIISIYKKLWSYYDHDNNVYLFSVKHKSDSDYKFNNEYSFNDCLYNLFSTYKDDIDIDIIDNIEEFCVLHNSSYYKNVVEDKSDYDSFSFNNEYGKVSLFMIIGIIFIIIGVLISIITL